MDRNCHCFELNAAEAIREQCDTCAFSACPACTYPQEIYCLRRAPESRPDGGALWPMVRRSDWCGEYRRAEGKKGYGC